MEAEKESVLDAYMFFDLYQARQLTWEWVKEYNIRRPHESLENLTSYERKMNLLKNDHSLKKLFENRCTYTISKKFL